MLRSTLHLIEKRLYNEKCLVCSRGLMWTEQMELEKELLKGKERLAIGTRSYKVISFYSEWL